MKPLIFLLAAGCAVAALPALAQDRGRGDHGRARSEAGRTYSERAQAPSRHRVQADRSHWRGDRGPRYGGGRGHYHGPRGWSSRHAWGRSYWNPPYYHSSRPYYSSYPSWLYAAPLVPIYMSYPAYETPVYVERVVEREPIYVEREVEAPPRQAYSERSYSQLAPRAEPAPPPQRIERVTLSATELFEFDKAVVRPPQPKLDQIADAMMRNAQIDNVSITGHTDRLGTDAYNAKLSQQRADAVKAYLVARGVAKHRLVATGKGESNPVVQCQDKNQAALIKCLEPNRRVEVEQITIERRVPQ